MRVAVTGATGLFGFALVQAFQDGHSVAALGHEDADITSLDELRSVFTRIRPEVVVHPAGIQDLDICEADPARGYLVNVHGTRNVVTAAREAGAAVAYISTDAVFEGKKSTPYVETDLTIPPSVYGRTKLRAEMIVRQLPSHWVFRVSVLFGPGKANFISKGFQRIRAGEDWVSAWDQTANATFTPDAAARICEVVEARKYGLFHLANEGTCTRYELARHAAELAGLDLNRVVGKPSAEMGRRAVRLKYSVMEMRALKQAGFSPTRPWQDALAEYVSSLRQ